MWKMVECPALGTRLSYYTTLKVGKCWEASVQVLSPDLAQTSSVLASASAPECHLILRGVLVAV